MRHDLRSQHVYTCYGRYSDAIQNPKSADDQVYELHEDTKKLFSNWKWYGHDFLDKAVSGRSVAKRKAFQEMVGLALQENPPFTIILVEETSRFARNKAESAQFRAQLAANGVKILSKEDSYIDPDSESGLWITGIKEIKAEAEARTLGRRVKRGQKAKARQGYSTGKPVNYGYRRKVIYSKETDKDGNPIYIGVKWDINREETRIVKLIFTLYGNKGWGYSKIATYLNNDLAVPNRKGKTWCYSAIRAILVNDVYLGYQTYNKYQEVRTQDGRRIKALNPKEDWIREKGHEALISKELWNRVVKRRKSYESRGKRFPKKQRGAKGSRKEKQVVGVQLFGSHNRRPYRRYPLSGLVRCDVCGSNMAVITSGGKRSRTAMGGSYRYYRCTNYLKNGSCTNGSSLELNLLHEDVFALLNSRVLNDESAEELEKEVRRIIQLRLRSARQANKNVFQEKKELDEVISRLTMALKQGVRVPQVIDQLKLYNERWEKVQSQLSHLERIEEQVNFQVDSKVIQSKIRSSKKNLDSENLSIVREELGKHIKVINVEESGRTVMQAKKHGLFSGTSAILETGDEESELHAGRGSYKQVAYSVQRGSPRPDHSTPYSLEYGVFHGVRACLLCTFSWGK